MIRLLFFILLISCGVHVQQDEIRSLAAPDNKILIIEEGKSVFKDIGEVLDSNQVARLSDIAIFDTASIYSVPTQTYILADTFEEGDYILTRNTGAWYKVQTDSVIGYTTDSVAVIPTGARYAVLQPQQGQYDVTWFGAVGDGVTNNDINKALVYANGRYTVFFPHGIYNFNQSIDMKVYGFHIEGEGSSHASDVYRTNLVYTGTGNAIETTETLLGGSSRVERISIQNLALVGSDSAKNGIMLDIYNTGGSLHGGTFRNLFIRDFSDSLSVGIFLSRSYGLSFDNIKIANCHTGIYLDIEAISLTFNNINIAGESLRGIYSKTSGLCHFANSIISSSLLSNPLQRAIYIEEGYITFDNVHMEGNYTHIETLSSASARISVYNSKFNSCTGNSTIFGEGSIVKLVNNINNVPVYASLGTEWVGSTAIPPSITSNNPVNFATVTYMDGSSGAFTLDNFSLGNTPSTFTLVFLDDSVTIQQKAAGSLPGRILLKDGLDFKGRTEDRIVFERKTYDAPTITISEVSRMRSRHIYNYQENYDVSEGDHELIFTNKGATDTVIFTLPDITHVNIKRPKYTFIKYANQVMGVKTRTGTPVIRGSSLSNRTLYLTDVGSSVTLQKDSVFWIPISSNGVLTHESPASGYTGGTIAGVGFDRLRDSMGLATITQDLIPFGQGSTTLGTYTGLYYNSTGGTNTRRITVANGTTGPFATFGVGNSEGSNRVGMLGYSNAIPTTAGAVNITAFRSEGNFGSPTNLTEEAAILTSISAKAYRGGSYRNAASITMSGGNSVSATGYSGIIGFATAANATFARRATIQRNGDFYLGDGLPTNDLASPSSKLLIRGNGTTTGYSLLIEDSAGDDKFTIQDNGTVSLPVAPTLNNAADSIVVRNNVTGAFELRSASTISGGGGGDLDTVAVKSSNTVFTEDMTLAAIGLDITLEAGEQYEFEGVIFISGDGDSKFALDGTATATTLKTSVYHRSSTVNYPVKIQALASTTSSDLTSATMNIIEFKGIITVNAGGTFGPRFAQNTDTDSTTAEIGSYISVRKI